MNAAVINKYLVIGLFLITSACSFDEGFEDKRGGANPKGSETDFDFRIDDKKCMDSFFHVRDWQEELASKIGFGDAACVKAILKKGGNANELAGKFRTKSLPIFLALEKSSLWFSSNKLGEFSTLKALVEAGADLSAKNDKGETALFHLLKYPKLINEFPTVPLYIVQTGKLDLDETDPNGSTALHLSIGLKNTTLAKALLLGGADAELKTRSGMAPLMLSFDNNLEELATYLVDQGVDINVKDHRDNLPLHRATSLAYEELAIRFSEAMKLELLNHQNEDGETPLLLAVQRKLDAVVRKLLSKKVDPDLRTASTTPVHEAISGNQPEVAGLLIAKIQNLNEKNRSGDTPVILAAKSKAIEPLTALLKRGANPNIGGEQNLTALHAATKNGDLRSMSTLLEHGAQVDLVSDSGWLPLHMAESVAAAELLIDAKSPVDAHNASGFSPLALAVERKQTELAKYLISKDADVQWIGTNDITLLHIAAGGNDLATLNLLIQNKVPVNAIDSLGQSPLYSAGTIQTIERLISAGANVNHTDHRGGSVLQNHVGTYLSMPAERSLDLIKKLIDLGADVDVIDTRGNSLLQLAVMSSPLPHMGTGDWKGYYKDLLPLLAARADVDRVNSEGNTALHFVDSLEEVRILNHHGANPSIKNLEGFTPLDVKLTQGSRLAFEIKGVQGQIIAFAEKLKDAEESENTREIDRLKESIKYAEIELAKLEVRQSELNKIIAELKKISGRL